MNRQVPQFGGQAAHIPVTFVYWIYPDLHTVQPVLVLQVAQPRVHQVQVSSPTVVF